jgi:small subunit ribosomal protein S17
MARTIVVEVARQKAHSVYRRVVHRSKRFYADDPKSSARLGDVVKIEETRPLSKLKRWRLVQIVRRATLAVPEGTVAPEEAPEGK